jgi:predicted HTH transcriptional regulator
MSLRHMELPDVNEPTLQDFIETGATESRDIECKRQTYGGNDDARAEFLADVSSFANTAGGDLNIGVKAETGVPVSLETFTADHDAEWLLLEAMARDGIEPRIPNLQSTAIPIARGGVVIRA